MAGNGHRHAQPALVMRKAQRDFAEFGMRERGVDGLGREGVTAVDQALDQRDEFVPGSGRSGRQRRRSGGNAAVAGNGQRKARSSDRKRRERGGFVERADGHARHDRAGGLHRFGAAKGLRAGARGGRAKPRTSSGDRRGRGDLRRGQRQPQGQVDRSKCGRDDHGSCDCALDRLLRCGSYRATGFRRARQARFHRRQAERQCDGGRRHRGQSRRSLGWPGDGLRGFGRRRRRGK